MENKEFSLGSQEPLNKPSRRRYFSYQLNNLVGFYLIVRSFFGPIEVIYSEYAVKSRVIQFFLRHRVSMNSINFNTCKSAFFDYMGLTFDLVEKLFPQLFSEGQLLLWSKILEISPKSLIISLKKYLCYELNNECQGIIFLKYIHSKEPMDGFFTSHSSIYKFKNIREFLPFGISMNYWVNSFQERLKGFKRILRFLSFFKKNFCYFPVLKGKEKREANLVTPEFVLSVRYPYRGQKNPEFVGLYHFLKDKEVVYLVPQSDSGIGNFLVAQGKKILIENKLSLSFVAWIRLLIKGIELCFQFVRYPIPSFLTKGLYEIFWNMIYFRNLFARYRPKYFIKIRSDFDPLHPIITAIAGQNGVGHIGYSCGSYTYFNYQCANLDFHWYGHWGDIFPEKVYKGNWTDKDRYFWLGPFTTDMILGSFQKPDKKRANGIRVGVFTTSTSNEMWMDDSFYDQFINDVSGCLNEYENLEFVISDKYIDQFRSNVLDRIGSNSRNLLEICTSTDRVGNKGYGNKTSYEILSGSDLVIVMGSSTIGWEALALKKKVIVYEQEWMTHLFEPFCPMLVVKNRAQLMNSLNWILNLSQKDYEKEIEIVLKTCCKEANGHLLKDFFDYIAKRDSFPKSV